MPSNKILKYLLTPPTKEQCDIFKTNKASFKKKPKCVCWVSMLHRI